MFETFRKRRRYQLFQEKQTYSQPYKGVIGCCTPYVCTGIHPMHSPNHSKTKHPTTNRLGKAFISRPADLEGNSTEKFYERLQLIKAGQRDRCMELCFVHQGLEHFSHSAPHIIANQVCSRKLLLKVSPYYDIHVIGNYPPIFVGPTR